MFLLDFFGTKGGRSDAGVWYLLPGAPGLRSEKNGVRIALIVRCSKVASTNEFDAAAMRGQLSLAFRVLAPRSVTN